MRGFDEINRKSLQYLEDNKHEVARTNQSSLVMINILYTIILATYYILSLTAFASWNVTKLYLTAVLVQIPILIFVILRYHKTVRKLAEVNFVCTLFQLYAMGFVCMMSIFPLEMNQPAVYMAPIGIAFAAMFVFSFYRSITLSTAEMILYIILSFFTKTKDVFFIDAASSALAIVAAIFLARVLNDYRARENESKQQIRRMGMMDALTGLYNKSSMEFLCRNYLKSDTYQACAIMILDFDNFKFVNDTYGHQVGDVVLKEFGKILREEAGEDNINGRFGGDECIVLVKKTNEHHVRKLAEGILNRTRMISAPTGETPFSCSIGIALERPNEYFGSSSEKYDELFSRADQILYQVKDKGKNNYMILS